MEKTAAAEEEKIILPFAFLTSGRAYLTVKKAPKKLTSNCFLALSSSVNSAAPEMPKPALQISTSILSVCLEICSKAFLTDCSSETSAVTWTIPSSSFPRRLSSNTLYPSLRNFFAAARPMPFEPPVMTRVFILLYQTP